MHGIRKVIQDHGGSPVKHVLRQIGKDTIAALAVLALVFLSFGHAPSSAAVAAPVASNYTPVSVLSFCGNGAPGDPHGLHGPCHACRVSAAVLPPPPSDAEPAFLSFGAAAFVIEDEGALRRFHADGYCSRAPPRRV